MREQFHLQEEQAFDIFKMFCSESISACFSLGIWTGCFVPEDFPISSSHENLTIALLNLWFCFMSLYILLRCFLDFLASFPFTVPRRRMVPLLMCWAHTRDQIQRKVVLSNLQAITAALLSCFSRWHRQCCFQYFFAWRRELRTKSSDLWCVFEAWEVCYFFLLGVELITGRVTNFNIKGEGEEKETVSGLQGIW